MADTRATFLPVNEQFNLNFACQMLRKAFGPYVYQVGSSIERADYRDVDIRCMMEDEEYAAFIGDNESRRLMLNVAVSEWLQARTGLPIDFQFQRLSAANAEHGRAQGKKRNAIGVPVDGDWV